MVKDFKTLNDAHNTHVFAYGLDNIHFWFDCPHCDRDHLHGSCNDFKNRTTSRSSHCEKWKGNFEIHITDDTKRFKHKQ